MLSVERENSDNERAFTSRTKRRMRTRYHGKEFQNITFENEDTPTSVRRGALRSSTTLLTGATFQRKVPFPACAAHQGRQDRSSAGHLLSRAHERDQGLTQS
jgi:hypothetical protein